jgi:hypothetical protein
MGKSLLIVSMLFLGGCVTPSGIVDVFVPPQAEPVVITTETRQCDSVERAAASGATDPDKIEDVIPCAVDVITTALAPRTSSGTPRLGERRRPLPPRIRR